MLAGYRGKRLCIWLASSSGLGAAENALRTCIEIRGIPRKCKILVELPVTGEPIAMKINAAVLDKMGAAAPYAISKPLAIRSVELAAPGPDTAGSVRR